MKYLKTSQQASRAPRVLDDTMLGHTDGGLRIGGVTNIAIGNTGPVYQAATQNFYQCP